MGDLLAFEGYMNETAPFTLKEHRVTWKSKRQYLDFRPSNVYKEKCQYPRFWLETGFPVGKDVTDRMVGCYDGEFDQVKAILVTVDDHAANLNTSMVIPKLSVSFPIGNVSCPNSPVSKIVLESGFHPCSTRS